jgi:hypothetical protein
MTARTFDELARDMRLRRTVGDRPPVLLLGAGASVDAGIGAMPDLYRFFDRPDFDSFAAYIATVSTAERYRYLSEFLQTRSPDVVTKGYQALAALCANHYFDLVLTANLDPLLDDALAAARLWRRDYMLLVNGIVRPDRLQMLLQGQSPRLKVVKLHGDLFQRYMAWTVAEMDAFLGEVGPQLAAAVSGRDFLVVGYSLRDARVRELVESAGGAVWFTHPVAVPAHLAPPGGPALPGLRSVVAPECAFERFFPALLAALQPEKAPTRPPAATAAHPDVLVEMQWTAAPEPRRTTRRAAATPRTLDDFRAAVFGVVGPDGVASSTAFLVQEPRVIVCDRYAAAGAVQGGSLEIAAANGHRHRARVVDGGDAHPFGPLVLEAPAEVKIDGLPLRRGPATVGLTVHVAVAAGNRTGLSDGLVKGTSSTIAIDPLPAPVAGLVPLDCFVAPGSSGAPVVDESMAVAGFVVAGSSDPDEPWSFMYPAEAWAASLSPRQGPRRRKRA